MPTIRTTLGPVFVDDQGAPAQPVALLWPSLFTEHRMWRHQTTALHAAGWRTLAIDPPGHGQSPGPGRRFTMQECAHAAIQILDASSVDTPVAYLGASWGGFIAPRIALLAPKRISGMVLFNTSAERGTPFERARATVLTKLLAVRALDKTTGRLIVSGLLAPKTRRRQPDLEAELSAQMLAWDRHALISTVRSALIDRGPVLDALQDVQVPTLVVSGEQDRTLPSVHSQRIVQHLPGARHVEVPRAAHLAPLEQPETANALILEFLERLPRT